MSGAVSDRPRPLSGGLWSLLGWLRRDEHSSSDSLSSGGSDRTTASFAFLPPHIYARAAAPAPLPPPGPPTDSYKRRVRDRNIRRQHERDITLHRKYLLPLGEGSPGFDAFSLPSIRRSVSLAEARQERERRAASESLQRRAAYVPGKRRAPPPPAPAPAPHQPTPAELRRRATKRPAPQPPHLRPDAQHNTLPRIKEKKSSIQMSFKPLLGERNAHDSDKTAGCKSEKYSRKDSQMLPKPRQEKSFLKQIFENRKRNSAIEPATVKLLPNISELDRQAAELMQTFKLKAYERDDSDASVGTRNDRESNHRSDVWFCTRCLKKYDSTMVTCLDCLSEANVSASTAKYKDQCLALKNISNPSNVGTSTEPSTSSKEDEKQKLKDMLKEMKDSLPQRPAPQKNGPKRIIMTFKEYSDDKNNTSKETPTLPMGSSIRSEFDPQPSCSKQSAAVFTEKINENTSLSESPRATETVLVTRTIVLQDPGLIVANKITSYPILENQRSDIVPTMSNGDEPLKMSSLFNPIYIPKSATNAQVNKSNNFAAKISFLEGSKPANDTVAETATTKLAEETSYTERSIAQRPQVIKESPPSSPKMRSSLQPKLTNYNIVPNPQASTNTSSAAITNVVNKALKAGSEIIIKSSETNVGSPISSPKPTRKKTNSKTILEEKAKINGNSSEPKVASSTASPKSLTEKTMPKPAEEPKAEINRNSSESKVGSPTSSSKSSTETTIPKARVEPKSVRIPNSSEPKEGSPPSPKSPKGKRILKVLVEPNSETSKPGTSSGTENKEPKSSPELLYKRRELISQLEKSIASGDEKAAAEAAIRLAQLKLSCSVLSFSSQILAENTPATSNTTTGANTKPEKTVIKSTTSKVNSSTQSVGTKCVKVILSSSATPKGNAKETCNASVPKESPPPKNTSAPTKTANTFDVAASAKPSTSNAPQKPESNTVPIEVWVEDREAARGPVRLSVSRLATVGLLRREAETALGIPAALQRWIVGHALCNDDSVGLASLAGPHFDAPFYLCLVESEPKGDQPQTGATIADPAPKNHKKGVYSELVELELRALVPNAEAFQCAVCIEECEAGAGVVLRDCVHAFCRDCLAASVRHSEDPAVACPATGCAGTLQEREIRSLVLAEEYERWLARGLATAESGTRHAFHCRTRDCAGWALAEPGVQRFPCPVCRRTNCVPCQAIHEGESCEQHRTRLREAALAAAGTSDPHTDGDTRALLDSLISRGEALPCPECSALITKKWGCDWVRCSACKTEICWVTRGRRWGPAGRGDTSAGCQCGVDGKRCHPSCGYCH